MPYQDPDPRTLLEQSCSILRPDVYHPDPGACFLSTRSFITKERKCILPMTPCLNIYKHTHTALLTAARDEHYHVSVARKSSPCGLSEPRSCWLQLKRGLSMCPLSSQGYCNLTRPHPTADADNTYRISRSEFLESRKIQPSLPSARWATATILSLDSLPL